MLNPWDPCYPDCDPYDETAEPPNCLPDCAPDIMCDPGDCDPDLCLPDCPPN